MQNGAQKVTLRGLISANPATVKRGLRKSSLSVGYGTVYKIEILKFGGLEISGYYGDIWVFVIGWYYDDIWFKSSFSQPLLAVPIWGTAIVTIMGGQTLSSHNSSSTQPISKWFVTLNRSRKCLTGKSNENSVRDLFWCK